MPDLNKIKAAYKAEPVLFLAFALDRKDQLNKFLKTHDFQYVILPDARKTHKDHGVYACPVSMVIDRNGLVSHILDAGESVVKVLPGAINAAISQ